ncbi:chromosome segregation in meiosis-related protein [Stygiomarasmius scandens]|uniref:Chromosome segregation in meiosis protein n=1 Tax=Marasmiellus scandens TaxID=2682957 RepID=A0ABR1JU49_9AGAR
MDPLFLPDADDDSNLNPPPEEIDIDEIFKGIDDDDLFKPAPPTKRFDIADEIRKADAQYKKRAPLPTPRQILPSSSPPRDLGGESTTTTKRPTDGVGKGSKDAEPKERKKPMRLDEARLVGPTGFPQLIENTKNFRIKGKGHEASDLNRLMQIYQYWTRSMYPKSQFRDTVERVEKLCHSKRMHNKLSMWRDEAHGIKPQPESEDEDNNEVIDLTENTQKDGTRRALASDAADYASSSPAPTRPPSSPGTSGRSDIEDEALDAAMRDLDEAFNAARAATQAVSSTSAPEAQKNTLGDDDEMWAALGEMNGSTIDNNSNTREDWDDEDMMAAFDDAHRDVSTASISRNSTSNDMLDDEEMWDMVREAEQAGTKEKVNTGEEAAVANPKRPLSIEEDPDMADFYEDP